MRYIKLLLTSTLIAGLAGCTNIPVNQDYSGEQPLTNYATYQWLNTEQFPTETSSQQLKKQQPFMAKRIETAILKNLHTRDALIVRNQPQAYIDYSYTVNRTEELEPSTTVGVGIGSGNVGFRGIFPIAYEKRVYENAVWKVYIYNAKQQLIWHGSAEKPVKKFKTPTEAQAYTQSIIDAIMAQYPPK